MGLRVGVRVGVGVGGRVRVRVRVRVWVRVRLCSETLRFEILRSSSATARQPLEHLGLGLGLGIGSRRVWVRVGVEG